jgi:hypothetical protein
MASLAVNHFAEQNIVAEQVSSFKYTFTFDGTEEQFVDALLRVMDTHGYIKQEVEDEDAWFPGGSTAAGNYGYYIEQAWCGGSPTSYKETKGDNNYATRIAFYWDTKEVWVS